MSKVAWINLTAAVALLAVCAYPMKQNAVYHKAWVQVGQFMDAPGCTYGTPKIKTAPPCVRVAMRVAAKKTARLPSGLYGYLLDLAQQSGTLHRTRVWRGSYDGVRVGQTVNAQIWKGKVVAIDFPERLTYTRDYPLFRQEDEMLAMRNVLFDCVLAILLIVIVWLSCLHAALAGRAKVPENSP